MDIDGYSAEIALLVSSFECPGHLGRVLASIGMQDIPHGMMEVVVTDDGSDDDTLWTVAEFAARAPFPVKLTLHAHEGFQLARCRNEGVLASAAPFVLFCDGDCVLPARHVREHLRLRRPRTINAGDCCRLPRAISERLDISALRLGQLEHWAPRQEQQRLKRQFRKARFYNFVRHPTKPKLIGNNIGIWRDDCERINGFDEKFIGWGCEDDDFRLRSRRAGLSVQSILKWTWSYHLWHPPTPTCPTKWRDGTNVEYFEKSAERPARCRYGLGYPSQVRSRIPGADMGGRSGRPPFAELVFVPGGGRFSGSAAVNVVVAKRGTEVPNDCEAMADFVLDRCEIRGLAAHITQRANHGLRLAAA